MKSTFLIFIVVVIALNSIHVNGVWAKEGLDLLPQTISEAKQSIVGVGTYKKTRRPPAIVFATGFAVLDGNHVLTNAHAIPKKLDKKHKEFFCTVCRAGAGRCSYRGNCCHH